MSLLVLQVAELVDDYANECYDCGARFPHLSHLREHFSESHTKERLQKVFSDWSQFEVGLMDLPFNVNVSMV